MLNTSECTSMTQNQIQRCASFVLNPPQIDISRLSTALILNYVVVALSILSFLLMLHMYMEKKPFNFHSMRMHNAIMCVEVAFSAATFALITKDGGFAPFLESLLTSGCYSTETVLFLVSLSSSLASATTLAVITLVVEILEPFESVPYFMAAKNSAPLFFVGMSALSLIAVALELEALMGVVDKSLLFYGRLHNPGYASLSTSVSNALCVTYAASRRYESPHVFLVNKELDIPLFLEANYPLPNSNYGDDSCSSGPMDTSFVDQITSLPIKTDFKPFKMIRCPSWGMLTLFNERYYSNVEAQLRLKRNQWEQPKSVLSSFTVLHMNCETRQVLVLKNSTNYMINVRFVTLDGAIQSDTIPFYLYATGTNYLSNQFIDCGEDRRQICFLDKGNMFDTELLKYVTVLTKLYVVSPEAGFVFLREAKSDVRSAQYLDVSEASYDVKDVVSGVSLLQTPIPKLGWPPLSSKEVPIVFASPCGRKGLVYKNDSWFALNYYSGEFTPTLPFTGSAFNISYGTHTMFMITTTDIIFLPKSLNAGEIVGVVIGCVIGSLYAMRWCRDSQNSPLNHRRFRNTRAMKVFTGY